MTTNTLRLLALAALFLAAGCGQKGPLYLPGNPSEVKRDIPTTNASTVPEEEREREDEDDEQR